MKKQNLTEPKELLLQFYMPQFKNVFQKHPSSTERLLLKKLNSILIFLSLISIACFFSPD